MTDRSAKIHLNGGAVGEVLIGGTNVANASRGFTLTSRAGKGNELTLDLSIYELDVEIDGAKILVPDATRDALIALGWTPPDAAVNPTTILDEIAIAMWAAAVVEHEPDWMDDNDQPPNQRDWDHLLVDSERERWRAHAKRLLAIAWQRATPPDSNIAAASSTTNDATEDE